MWKASGVVEQRIGFVLEWEAGMETMTELCDRYGISRKTGYKILGGWQQDRVAGLPDRNRAPRRHPKQMAAAIEPAVLQLRRAHARCHRRKAPPYSQPFAAANAANQVWCMDFKGWFRTPMSPV